MLVGWMTYVSSEGGLDEQEDVDWGPTLMKHSVTCIIVHVSLAAKGENGCHEGDKENCQSSQVDCHLTGISVLALHTYLVYITRYFIN